jgi:hypothetical protein
VLNIYVDHISTRLLYTLKFVFEERGIAYELCNDFMQFESLEGIKLNYSERHFENIPQLVPSALLFEETVKSYSLDKGIFHREECLSFDGILDPLASVFFVLTRMEEYTSEEKDAFGRFQGTSSVLFYYGWHEKAMCDRWALDFCRYAKDVLGLKWRPKLERIENIPTFDIDNAFAFQHKNFFRTQLGTLKDHYLKRQGRISDRKKVLAGEMKDPYDTFDFMQSIAQMGQKINIFWLLGDYGQYDKNLPHFHPVQRALIQRMSEVTEIGIHASFASNENEAQLGVEIERLRDITEMPITRNRQHFLMLNLPFTYQSMIRQGITDDYSMGYADIVGFRAGTARVFTWFDLHKNDSTSLRIHPFAYMDGTLNEYLKLTVEESKEKIDGLFKEVCHYGGQFSYIWHNETIGNYAHWNGWKDVFTHALNLNQADFI